GCVPDLDLDGTDLNLTNLVVEIFEHAREHDRRVRKGRVRRYEAPLPMSALDQPRLNELTYRVPNGPAADGELTTQVGLRRELTTGFDRARADALFQH